MTSQVSSSWMPGHLPLGGGKTVSLEPRTCGELKVGAGRIGVGSRVFAPGERLQLWRGDRVELVNVASGTALFAWDACSEQPKMAERARRLVRRVARHLFTRAAPELTACGEAAWCVRG